MKKTVVLIASLLMASFALNCQQVYFVDGFHGGVYGHYPMKTYTKYMSDLLEQNPEWRMCIEIEPETWDTVKVVTPADYNHFKNVTVKSKRVEFTNPTYAQPYCYNIEGESLIRQFEYGIKKIREHFPDVTFDTYAVEEPCFTSALPQVLKGFGFKYASLKNPNTCWGGYAAAHGGEIVNFIGPDGSSILCSPRHEIEDLGDNAWTTKSNGLYPEYCEAAFAAGFKHPVMMTYQDAGWTNGPWLGENKAGAKYVTWKEYFEDIAADVEPEDYVFSQEDVCGALMWGTQVMQRIGQSVRHAENSITQAEKMGVIANMSNGYKYNQSDVDEAWRGLLLAQHHDSWIVPYNGLKGKGSWADWITDTWTANCDKIASKVSSSAQRSFMTLRRPKGPVTEFFLRVFNTMPESREEVLAIESSMIPADKALKIEDAAGNEVPYSYMCEGGIVKLLLEAKAPAFGYSTYKISLGEDKPLEAKPAKKGKVIENDMYRIKVNPRKGGIIKSIKVKGGEELVGKGKYAFGELCGYFCDEGRFFSSADSKATVTVVEDNDFEKSLLICGMISSHPFTEKITIRKGDPKIDFKLDINWQGNVNIEQRRQPDAYNNPERACYDEDYKLNIYFPSTIDEEGFFKNAPFDVCESRQESTRFHNWNDIKHNIILNWVSLEGRDGRGLAILSDHTTAYVKSPDKPLGLTVQASGDGLWGRKHDITGPTSLCFALVPHDGGWARAESEDRKWNEPLTYALDMSAEMKDVSFLECGYEIPAAHLTDGGVLVRFYNASGDENPQEVIVNEDFAKAVEVDLLGNEIKEIELKDGKMELSMPRFAFRTVIFKK